MVIIQNSRAEGEHIILSMLRENMQQVQQGPPPWTFKEEIRVVE